MNSLYGTKYSRMDQANFVEDNPFKDLKEYCLLKQTILLQISQRLSSTNVTWSILEYFVIYASSNAISITRIGTQCDATLY